MFPCLAGLGSRLPGITSWFPGLQSMVVWWRILVALIRFLVPSTWFNGCPNVSGCLDSLPCYFLDWLGRFSGLPVFTSWVPGLWSMVAWWRFLVAWVQFMVPLTWFYGCLVKVPGCLGSLHGSLDFVPWLHVEGLSFSGLGCPVKVAGSLE